jgi:hypothetical protein
LEVITLQDAGGLYELYPDILDKNLPKSLLVCLKSSLAWDPRQRTSFQSMYDALNDDDSIFGEGDDLVEAPTWIPSGPLDSSVVKSSVRSDC